MGRYSFFGFFSVSVIFFFSFVFLINEESCL